MLCARTLATVVLVADQRVARGILTVTLVSRSSDALNPPPETTDPGRSVIQGRSDSNVSSLKVSGLGQTARFIASKVVLFPLVAPSSQAGAWNAHAFDVRIGSTIKSQAKV